MKRVALNQATADGGRRVIHYVGFKISHQKPISNYHLKRNRTVVL